MTDPEDGLTFKFKRKQFNHRIPQTIVDMFDDIGEDKKYVLEYMLWLVCKYMGNKLPSVPDWEVQMFETYFAKIKDHFAANRNGAVDTDLLFSLERDIEAKMDAALQKRAARYAGRDDAPAKD